MRHSDALAEQLVRLLDVRLADPLEILLDGDDSVGVVRGRLHRRALDWASVIEHGPAPEAVHTLARLIATLYPDDHAFAPPVEWWRTPLGQAVARRVGHPFAASVSYAMAGAMLGISRQGVHDLVRRGKLPRHPDGGVPVSAVRERLLATSPLATSPVAADPLATSPVAADPLGTSPVAADPLGTSPVAADPLVTEPLVAEPADSLPGGHGSPSARPTASDDFPGRPADADWHSARLARAGQDPGPGPGRQVIPGAAPAFPTDPGRLSDLPGGFSPDESGRSGESGPAADCGRGAESGRAADPGRGADSGSAADS
ncbi:hypothetical protein, partial [Actinoplanes octamycinicus]